MLNSTQTKAIELLAFKGLTQAEVAQELNIHRNTITNWKKNDEFFAELEKANKQNLKIASVIALRVMIGLLSSESEEIRFKAAKDIMDRSFQKKEGLKLEVVKRLEDWFEDFQSSENI